MTTLNLKLDISNQATGEAGTGTITIDMSAVSPPPPPPPIGPAFYVSTSGSDSAAGSQSAPFRTLGKAQQAMQSSTTKMALIGPGTYTISAWNFSSADNGETWAPLNGPGTVTIDAGGSGYISANSTTGITIKGFTIRNLGLVPNNISGVLINGTKGIAFRWNTFLNSKQCVISGMNVQNAVIDSNTIDGVTLGSATTTLGYSGIQLYYGSSGNQITHNLVQNCDGGGLDLDTGAFDPPLNNNTIDRNKLVNVLRVATDNGALYIMDRTHSGTGNKITNNTVNGYGSGSIADQTKAIYLDDGASNVQVVGNVIYGTPGQWAVQYHGGQNNYFHGNVFALKPGQQLALYQSSSPGTSMTGNQFTGNIVYYDGGAPNPIWRVGGTGITMPSVSTNLYYAADGSSVPNSGSAVDSKPFFGNPQFASANGGNFSMPSGSPAYANIGWQTLPTDQGPVAYQR
jgi:hypothetical protein